MINNIMVGEKGIGALLDALKNIIEFLKTLFKFIASIFKATGVALQIILQMTQKIFIWIATLPVWLLPFATITIIISMIYFIVGRQAGKSD